MNSPSDYQRLIGGRPYIGVTFIKCHEDALAMAALLRELDEMVAVRCVKLPAKQMFPGSGRYAGGMLDSTSMILMAEDIPQTLWDACEQAIIDMGGTPY